MTPFEADAAYKISLMSMYVRNTMQPCPYPLRREHTHEFSFIAVIAGKRTADVLNLYPQPPRKVARLVELSVDDPEGQKSETHGAGLELALCEVDNAIAGTATRSVTPLVTQQVRRSPRANKYDGFRVSVVTDAKVKKSKVKPINKPSFANATSASTSTGQAGLTDDGSSTDMPPPTPISTLQCIGIHLCGVAPADISPVKLLASLQGEDDKLI